MLDLSKIIPTKENIRNVLNELNDGTNVPLTQEDLDELTYQKRLDEAEERDRSFADESYD